MDTFQLKGTGQTQEFIFELKSPPLLSEITMKILNAAKYPVGLSSISYQIKSSSAVDSSATASAQARLNRRIAFRKEASDYLLRDDPHALITPYTEGKEIFKSILIGDGASYFPIHLLQTDSSRLRILFKGNMKSSQIAQLLEAYTTLTKDTIGKLPFLPVKVSKANIDIYFLQPVEIFLAGRMMLLNPTMLQPAKPGESLNPRSTSYDATGAISPVYILKTSNDSIKVALVKTYQDNIDGDVRMNRQSSHLFFYNDHDQLERYVVFTSTDNNMQEKIVLYEFTYTSQQVSKIKKWEALFDGFESTELVMSVWEAALGVK